MMREIQTDQIIDAVAELCVRVNCVLQADVESCIRECRAAEPWPQAEEILGRIVQNMELAKRENRPVCQDTGAACVFVELGQDAHIIGGSLEDAIHEGVRRGYAEGYLRKSIVADPLRRVNTGDNTPAMITWNIVPGDRLKLTVAPKGFGSENMSRVKMLPPSDGIEGVIDFVVETVELAGSNPCPPIVVGVGIGGTFDKVAALAKQALLRPLNSRHPDPYYAELEDTLLEKINALGIGPQGFGGKTTALAVNVEAFPTHIAGLPAAVNLNCHVTRHGEVVL
jgi:fumarate hydratase subunit alpha